MSPFRSALLALVSVLALAACGDDAPDLPTEDLATADAVADAMLARYESNLGDVEAFTVVAAGAEARYAVSDDTTGLDRFGTPDIGPVGDAAPEPEAQLLFVQVPNVARLAAGLRGATLAGPLARDGRRAYGLTTDDPGALFGQPGVASRDTTETREFRVYVDAATFDVLEIYQIVSADSLAQPITSRIIYSDFQETDGLVLPHTVQQVETGMNQAMDDADRMVMGGQIGMAIERLKMEPASPERDAQLADLEAQQRIVAEGVTDMTMEVTSVRVGAGAEE
jgi:predicted small lipoprotein YifL